MNTVYVELKKKSKHSYSNKYIFEIGLHLFD